MEVHLVIIDFRKAFDTIDHKCLITASWMQGIDGKILAIIKNKTKPSPFEVFLIRVRRMHLLAKPKNEDHLSCLADSHLT